MRLNIVGIVIFCALITGAVFHIGGCNKSNGSGGAMVGGIQNEFTPIVVSFVTQPHPVLGSDGKYHLVYELQLTNATSFTWVINSLEVLDAYNNEKIFAAFSGDTVTPNNQIIPGRIPSETLARGETSIFFITFSVDNLNDVPEKITHRLKITVPGGIPEGFLAFLSLPPDTQQLVQIEAESYVPEANAIVMGPPLEAQNG